MSLPLLSLLGCPPSTVPPEELPFEQRPIDPGRMARAFPSDRVADRSGWASDLAQVLALDGLPATIGNACAVIAVVEQESNFDPDPAVPGIGGMVDEWLAQEQDGMRALPAWGLEVGLRALLATKPPGQDRTFDERLRAAKTERDVDLVFREMVDYHLPEGAKRLEGAAAFVGLEVDDFNPITTAGCMQVKVDFARAHARMHGAEPGSVRDALYTREGCLHYGTWRLLGFDASYEHATFRFADFNAGMYSSRNAAFQEQVAALSGRELALDGDLLAYGELGRSVPSATSAAAVAVLGPRGVGEWRVMRDLEYEKDRDFEATRTWKEVRAAYREATGREPAYARLPEVALDSVKLKGEKSTAWFAKNVDIRYQRCLARVR